jgi:pimeloyl-ACP methyl ester carboxylesterase
MAAFAAKRRSGLSGAAVLAALAVATAAAPVLARDPLDPSGPGRLVALRDGRKINFRCVGPAVGPTVIFEAGFANTSTVWAKVQRLMASRRRSCAYDRAGYGWSDAGPMPRDGEAVARDLDAALSNARIPGPYILVGHSAGGLYVLLFARLRPRDVVGMVLVDPSVPHQDRRFARLFGPRAGSLAPLVAKAKACEAAARRRALPSADPRLIGCGGGPGATAEQRRDSLSPAAWATELSELGTLWGATSDEVEGTGQSLGQTPVIVLTAGANGSGLAAAAWAQMHRELAARSSRGSAQLVAGSSHMIMLDKPQAVVAAIDEVAKAAGR